MAPENNECENPIEMTLLKLLGKCPIEIPAIQRDYALGRSAEHPSSVRAQMLSEFYNTACKETSAKGHCLDFILGTHVKRGDENVFMPIDGQQRLTTLWLFHVYHCDTLISQPADFSKEETYCGVAKLLGKFSYVVRDSACSFCKSLVTSKHLKSLYEKKTSSNPLNIREEGWFLPSWDYDPTIDGMCTMLEAIHDYYHSWKKDNGDLYREWFNRITFHRYILTTQKEDDEENEKYYRRLNARGKPLSEFENFKAILEGVFKSCFKEHSSAIQEFEHRVDTEWQATFWRLNPPSPDDKQNVEWSIQKSVDTPLVGHILALLCMRVLDFSISPYSKSFAEAKAATEKAPLQKEGTSRFLLESIARELLGKICTGTSLLATEEKLKEICCKTDTVAWITETMSDLSKKLDRREALFPRWAMKFEINYAWLTALYAYYLIGKRAGWMRIVWNRITNFESFVNVPYTGAVAGQESFLRLIKELSEIYSKEDFPSKAANDNPLQYLMKTNFSQAAEEEVKQGLLKSESTKDLCAKELLEAESLPWVKGRLSLVFRALGNGKLDAEPFAKVCKKMKDDFVPSLRIATLRKILSRVYKLTQSIETIDWQHFSIPFANSLGDDNKLRYFFNSVPETISDVRKYQQQALSAWLLRTQQEEDGFSDTCPWLERAQCVGLEKPNAFKYYHNLGIYAFKNSNARNAWRVDDAVGWWYVWLKDKQTSVVNLSTYPTSSRIQFFYRGNTFAFAQNDWGEIGKGPVIQILRDDAKKGEDPWHPVGAEAIKLCQGKDLSATNVVDDIINQLATERPSATAKAQKWWYEWLDQKPKERELVASAPKNITVKVSMGDPQKTATFALSQDYDPNHPGPAIQLAIRQGNEIVRWYPDQGTDSVKKAVAWLQDFRKKWETKNGRELKEGELPPEFVTDAMNELVKEYSLLS